MGINKKMKKTLTLTVGIPVFNEGANIQRLLRSIYAQKALNLKITEIIVSSDGSNDDTVEKTRAMKHRGIKLTIIANKDRKGIARGLNQILKKSTSDLLVTLDGDIQINDKHFMEKLVRPIIENKADLTSSTTSELKPVSWVAKSLHVSMKIKRTVFHSFLNGNNLYTCFGLARGYSKRFYKQLNFKVSVGNDMYSYLSCLSRGFQFVNARDAVAFYRLPESFIDHEKQSTRFVASPLELANYFDVSLIQKETTIPLKAVIKASLKIAAILLSSPVDFVCYVWIQLNIKMRARVHSTGQAWDIATSSKHL